MTTLLILVLLVALYLLHEARTERDGLRLEVLSLRLGRQPMPGLDEQVFTHDVLRRQAAAIEQSARWAMHDAVIRTKHACVATPEPRLVVRPARGPADGPHSVLGPFGLPGEPRQRPADGEWL